MRKLCVFICMSVCAFSYDSVGQTTLLSQNFNSPGTPAGWIKLNNSVGGATALSDWSLRQDGYTYTSTFVDPPETFHSNDNSAFYLSNSDAQVGDVTETILQSPVFSTSGFNFITLNFYHYFWEYQTDTGFVEISTDATNWTKVEAYHLAQDSKDGASDQFVQKTINISTISNSANVYLRFRYYAEFGYYWALDNVVVTGSNVVPCATNNWEGTVNSAWENPANWSCGTVPNALVAVTVAIGKANYPVISSVAACKSIQVATGATVNVAAGFRLDIGQ